MQNDQERIDDKKFQNTVSADLMETWLIGKKDTP